MDSPRPNPATLRADRRRNGSPNLGSKGGAEILDISVKQLQFQLAPRCN